MFTSRRGTTVAFSFSGILCLNPDTKEIGFRQLQSDEIIPLETGDKLTFDDGEVLILLHTPAQDEGVSLNGEQGFLFKAGNDLTLSSGEFTLKSKNALLHIFLRKMPSYVMDDTKRILRAVALGQAVRITFREPRIISQKGGAFVCRIWTPQSYVQPSQLEAMVSEGGGPLKTVHIKAGCRATIFNRDKTVLWTGVLNEQNVMFSHDDESTLGKILRQATRDGLFVLVD